MMEREIDDQLVFLHVLVLRRADDSLRHKIYRKLMHTNRYVHKLSNHLPRQKPKTLVDQVKGICEPWFFYAELQHLEQVLQTSGCSAAEMRRAIQLRRSGGSDESVSQEFVCLAVTPYIWDLTDHIGWEAIGEMRCQDILQADQEDPTVSETGEGCPGSAVILQDV